MITQDHTRHPASSSNNGDYIIIRPLPFEPSLPTKIVKRRITRRQQLLLGAGLFSVLTLLFLFAARALHVTSNAEHTRISLSGLSIGFGEHILTLPGRHTLRASAPGYAEHQQSVVISDQQNQQLQLTLAPLPGQLTIRSTVAADVMLDGQPVGKTEQTLVDISAGQHELRIKAPRYRELIQPITIEGRSIHQELKIELQPAWGTVAISSTPAAEFFVDDIALGTTTESTSTELTPADTTDTTANPALLTVEIEEGTHQLRLKANGYKTWQQTLTISAGATLTLPAVTLEKADGLVQVSSEPSGASVTVDGKFQGKTPLELSLPPGRATQVLLFKQGYAPQQHQVTAQSDNETILTVNLTAELGEVVIHATPADAQLSIDGRALGNANQRLTLPTSQHQLRISKPGFADFHQVLTPKSGLRQEVTATLLTLAQQQTSQQQKQKQQEKIAPRITSRAGETLLLFHPQQTFTMGASRREQGRRANEVLRDAHLERAFYLATTETTNAQYRHFEKFYSSSHINGKSLNGDNQPVVNISWQQAARYCNWLSEQEKLAPFYQVSGDKIIDINPDSNGYRLATEAEWEWAAREQQDSMLTFAWGAAMPPAPNSGNYADSSATDVVNAVITHYNDSFAVSAPVGSFAVNHKGLADMSGNVAEWVNDFYSVDGTSATGSLSTQAIVDPLGPLQGDHHVIRGSSWAQSSISELRYSYRDYSADARNDLGFRIARYANAR